MGGSGRSYSPPPKQTVDCADLSFSTAIASVQHIDQLEVGEILSLEKNAQREIIFKKLDGLMIGKLFSSHLIKLSNCINRGFGYSAKIDEIKDGVCRATVFCSKSP